MGLCVLITQQLTTAKYTVTVVLAWTDGGLPRTTQCMTMLAPSPDT